MKYRRKPIVIEVMPLRKEMADQLGYKDGNLHYLATYPDGNQAVMSHDVLERDFEEIKRERMKPAPVVVAKDRKKAEASAA